MDEPATPSRLFRAATPLAPRHGLTLPPGALARARWQEGHPGGPDGAPPFALVRYNGRPFVLTETGDVISVTPIDLNFTGEPIAVTPDLLLIDRARVERLMACVNTCLDGGTQGVPADEPENEPWIHRLTAAAIAANKVGDLDPLPEPVRPAS
jgi:hypothetical protein